MKCATMTHLLESDVFLVLDVISKFALYIIKIVRL